MEMTLSGVRLLFVAVAISLAAFMVSLDGLIVNVALTTISGELGVREDIGTWVITLFSMASTLFIPVSGWLARRFGRIHLFVFSALGFSIISLLCGLAHNFNVLLILRVIQGAFAGILTPLSLSLIIAIFPEDKRSIAVGFWSFFVIVGPAMGPMLGGLLSNYHWAWLFYINVPVGLFSAATVLTLIKKPLQLREPLHFDWLGVFLLFLGLGSLQVGLNRGNVDDWFRSPFITFLFIIAAVSMTFFVVWESFHPLAFFDFAFLRTRNFYLASGTTGIAMALLFSSFVLDSLWVQQVLGYTPAWAGFSLTPVGLFPLIIYPIMGKFVGRLDYRIWIGTSFVLYACTFFWLSNINLYTAFWQLALPRLVQGIGFAMLTVPNSLLAIQGVSKERMLFAIANFSFIRMLFVGLTIPLATTLWSRRENFYQSRMVEQTYSESTTFTHLKAPFETLDFTPHQVDGLSYAAIQAQASTLGLADIYYLFGWLFLALVPVLLFYQMAAKSAKVAQN